MKVKDLIRVLSCLHPDLDVEATACAAEFQLTHEGNAVLTCDLNMGRFKMVGPLAAPFSVAGSEWTWEPVIRDPDFDPRKVSVPCPYRPPCPDKDWWKAVETLVL